MKININTKTYFPFKKKTSSNIFYVSTEQSIKSHSISFKTINSIINKRFSKLSNKKPLTIQTTLSNSSNSSTYNFKLESDNKNNKRKKRLFTHSLQPKNRKEFLKLIDYHFDKSHPYNKIFK